MKMNITCQKLWDTTKAVPRDKVIPINAYFREKERSQIYELNFFLKKWGKKSNKNKIQIKQNKGNIDQNITVKYKHKKSMKPTAFKNTYMYIILQLIINKFILFNNEKIDKPLTRLSKGTKNKNTEIANIKYEKVTSLQSLQILKRLIGGYYEQFYVNKCNNKLN